MKRTILLSLALLTGIISRPIPARAEESAATVNAPATQPAADADADALIRQLGADDFHARIDAAKKLKALGKAAVPALQQARKSQDPEVHARVEELLQEIEQPPVDSSPVPQPTGFGNYSTSVSINNGAKTVNVHEPGRTIQIQEDLKGIAMTVTGQIDGKEVTREYKAKNAEQLKKDNPNAFALYQRYAGGGQMIQFQAGGAGAGNVNIRIQGNIRVNGVAVAPGPGAGANVAPQQLNVRNAGGPNANGDNLDLLERNLLLQMKARNLPDAQQDEVKGLLKELREAKPAPDKDANANMRDYDERCDALRKKLADLNLPDPGNALPPPSSTRLGITAAEETTPGQGLTIIHILPGSRAEKMELKEQDIIQKVNGQEVHSTQELRKMVVDHPKGLVVEGLRDGKPFVREEGGHAPEPQSKKLRTFSN